MLRNVMKTQLCKSFLIYLLLQGMFTPFLKAVTQENIFFSTLTTDDGLSQFTAQALYADERGQIWIGTRNGISVYNGARIKSYKQEKGNIHTLLGRKIKNICGNGKGIIYILAREGLCQFNMRTEEFKHLSDNSSKEWINSIFYHKRNLYLGSYGSVFEYDEKSGERKVYCTFPKHLVPNCLMMDKSGQLWVGHNDGVFIVSSDGEVNKHLFKGVQIHSFFQDSLGEIWVCTWSDGVYRVSSELTVVHYIENSGKNTIADNSVRCVCEDDQGSIWLGTERGLNKFDKKTGLFTCYVSSERFGSLSNSSIFSILKDQQGTIWIGTYFGGVNYFTPDYQVYTHYRVSATEKNGLSASLIGPIIEGENNELWIATDGGGLNCYDRDTGNFKWYRHKDTGNGLSKNIVKSLYYDKKRKAVWIGTHQGGLNKLDLQTEQISVYGICEKAGRNDIVLSIVPYRDKLVISTHDGIFLFDPDTNQSALLINTFSHYLMMDSNDRLWAAVEGTGVYCYDMKNNHSTVYSFEYGNSESLSDNLITCIYEDSQHNIWLTTGDGMINRFLPAENNFERFVIQRDNASGDYIYAICESKEGDLFMTTDKGFCIFNLENKEFSYYNSKNGFPFTNISENSLFQAEDGEIFLGGMNGMISFNEEDLKVAYQYYRIIPDRLWVNGNEVRVGDETGILSEALYYTSFIELDSKYSVFSFEFTETNYLPANKDELLYKLEGFSKDWLSTHGQKMITFTNLPAGEYILSLKAVGKRKDYETEYRLGIKVLPPFYKTTWAYVFYVLAGGSIIYFLVRVYLVRFRLRESLKYEQQHLHDVELLNQSKLRFFTNISHEFRTPLTIIIGQMEMLLQLQAFAPSVYNKILNVYKNALQLRELISELLDFRKQEQGHMKIMVSCHDLIDFIYENYLLYVEYAATRQIDFHFERDLEKLEVWYDAKQIQKVMNNLLSNAFKFTPQGGTVLIRVYRNQDEAIVEVQNSGEGISQENIDKIFTRFYSVDPASDMVEGTGIGLSLSKGIVELHHGTLTACSIPDKETIFTLRLKLGNEHFAEEQLQVDTKAEGEISNSLFVSQNMCLLEEEKVSEHPKNAKMLIVEDNDSLREMLVGLFRPYYDVALAVDGEDGTEKAREFCPDIILSDIVMPKMTGTEFCKQIKTDFATCHIPVVLLTARTAVEHTLEGFRIGADDYITKPFNTALLISRCNNLVNGRRILQEKFSKQPQAPVKMLAINPMDEDLLERTMEIIERNLDNSEFGLNDLIRELCMSRTYFFQKIKGITGQTPQEFLTTVRLKKAAFLLKTDLTKNVSEISDKTGFSSPRFFSRCFKEAYGVSPLAYRNDNAGLNEEN